MVSAFKRALYGRRGDPVRYGPHTLRYVVGTRPPRMAYAHSDDVVVRNELAQIRLFLEQIKPGAFVLDVGGHTGQYAVLFGALVGPTGRVITFEPDPHARTVLARNLELNNLTTRVEIEPIALSDSTGEITLWSRGGDSMSSFARTGLGSNANAPDVVPLKVRTEPLDGYLARRGLPAPDAVKLDVEGAEIHVLRGASGVLASPAFVLCELHPYAWPELGVEEQALRQLLAAAGRRFDPLHSSVADGAPYAYGSGILRPAG